MTKREAIDHIRVLSLANKLREVRKVFDEHPDLKASDFVNDTPIHHLCMSKHKNIKPLLKFLIDKGFDINAYHRLFKTPLMTTIRENGPIKHIEILKECGAKLDLKIDREGNAIYEAALRNRPEHLKKLIELGASLDRCDAQEKSHAAMIAIEKNNWEALEVILKHDPSILKADNIAEVNLLHTAVTNKKTDLAIRLIEYKEKPTFKERILSTPKEVIMDIENYKFLDDCLLHACRYNQVKLIEILIKAGANPHLKQPYMQTPYIIAKNKGFNEIVKTIEAIAPIDIKKTLKPLDKYEDFEDITAVDLAGAEETKLEE